MNEKGFKKCCMSTALDETDDDDDDDMSWNGSKDVGIIRSQCEENECTNCEDGDSGTDWLKEIESDMVCLLYL